MAISFPSSPNNGDIYTYNGTKYVFDGVKWVSGGATAFVLGAGDTMTGALNVPAGASGTEVPQVQEVVQKTGDTLTGQLTLPGGGTGSQAATVDQVTAVDTASVAKAGDTMTGNLTVPSLNGGQIGFRNQIINGDFTVWQRGTDGTAALDNTYVSADRWMVGLGCRLVKRDALGTVCPGFASGASFFTAASRESLHQGIELPVQGNAGQFAIGSTWTLSIWSTVTVSAQIAFSDGTFFANEVVVVSGSMQDTGETRISSDGTQTYRKYTLTGTINSEPASTNKCLSVRIITPGATLALLAGVQLEPGPVATPFEHRPIQTELALCQRYYNSVSNGFFRGFEINDGGGTKQSVTYFPTTMRATPTVAVSGGDAATVAWNYPYGFGANFTTAAGNGVAFTSYTADAEL